MGGRHAALEQLSPALPEQAEIVRQRHARSPDIGRGLLQRQRQPAQLAGELGRCFLVGVAGAVGQEPGRGLGVQDRHVQHLGAGPVLALAGHHYPAAAGRRQEPPGRRLVRRIVEDQQPGDRGRGQHRVHGGDRPARIGQVAATGLCCQLGHALLRDQGLLGRNLPDDADLGQVPVGVLGRQAGLADTAHPGQRHRPRRAFGREQVMQQCEQVLPAGQGKRAWRQ
jgi:hypothetical protein